MRRRGFDGTTKPADRAHDRLHPFWEVDNCARVGIRATEFEPDHAVAERCELFVDLLPTAHDREARSGAGPPVPEVVGARRVRELDRVGVTNQLEPHADRQPRGGDGVPGQPAEVIGIGTGVRDLVRSLPRATAHERRGIAHRSAIGYGNLAPTPPSTVTV